MLQLDRAAIERAIPLVKTGLKKYLLLQTALESSNVASDIRFQTQFNAFYRVRRNAAWRSAFYQLLRRQQSQPKPFADVIRQLYNETDRVEASFASKLVASVDPQKPVIDSFVLTNLGLRLLQGATAEQRLTRAVKIYNRIDEMYTEFLQTELGEYLKTQFEERYPARSVSPIKMLDLVLWQTR